MILELQKKYIAKELTVSAHIQSLFEKIEALNSTYNVYITIDKENALKVANDQDLLIKQASDLAALFEKFPLLGVGVGVKDIFSTKD